MRVIFLRGKSLLGGISLRVFLFRLMMRIFGYFLISCWETLLLNGEREFGYMKISFWRFFSIFFV